MLRERVADYPRPPVVVPCERRVRIVVGAATIADSTSALRVLETSSPPTVYVPAADVRDGVLELAPDRHTVCEWKGRADYWDAEAGGRHVDLAAWSYPDPVPAFASLRGHFAFFAGRVDACYLGEERVRPQPGAFYGGWVTDDIEGPFKGEPGTEHW